MASFESIFPTFLQKCADLHNLLLVVAFMLFIVGVILRVAHGFTPKSMTMFMVRLLILTALLVFLPAWGNQLVKAERYSGRQQDRDECGQWCF